MAELITTERLQPCLLDRLTDLSPDQKTGGKGDRVISMVRYREGVLRDLLWLMNTSAHLSEEGFDGFPEVEKSVLNFGTRNLCGVVSTSIDLRDYENQLGDAISFFEPRINRKSLSVSAVDDPWKAEKNLLSFEIRGDLWAYPMPEQLCIETKVDLETGELAINKK